MVGISHDEVGSDEDLAREVILVARSIAPCIATFEEGDPRQRDALAVIRRVYQALEVRGSHMVASEQSGSTAVRYAAVETAFDGQPARALRTLCAEVGMGGHSQGVFPTGRPISRVWPEAY